MDIIYDTYLKIAHPVTRKAQRIRSAESKPFCLFCLQVNGLSLIGETHKEVVCLLKELPVRVCVVCSRLIPPTLSEEDDADDNDVQLTLKELLAEFNEKVL